MRVAVALGLLALGSMTGCGGAENDAPAGTGGAGTDGAGAGNGGAATGGSSSGSGGSASGSGGASAGGSTSGGSGPTTGTGGTGGSSTASGGAGNGGPNVYPDGDDVKACWGDCPRGECDDSGFFADAACDAAYPAPIDETASYCGSGNGVYCLEIGNGDMFAVQCTAGRARVRLCPNECGAGTGGLDCS